MSGAASHVVSIEIRTLVVYHSILKIQFQASRGC